MITISIRNSPDRRLNKLVKDAIQIYAKKLGMEKLGVNIRLRFDDKIEYMGYAEPHEDSVIPFRDFNLRCATRFGAKNIFLTLAHEMVHIKQFARSPMQMFPEGYDAEGDDYWFQLIEVEAYGLENGLYQIANKELRLYELFTDIKPPGAFPDEEPISWR